MSDRIAPWMMEEVRRYLEQELMEVSVEYFPRGHGNAVLFVVNGRPSHVRPRELLHQLWVDRSFFLRHAERTVLRGALETTDVAASLKRAGDKIVELR